MCSCFLNQFLLQHMFSLNVAFVFAHHFEYLINIKYPHLYVWQGNTAEGRSMLKSSDTFYFGVW